MIRSKQLHLLPAIGVSATALVLMVSCGQVPPPTSPTTLPATATSIPPQKTTTSLPTEIPPSPAATTSPTRSPAEVLGITPSPPSTDTVLLAYEDGPIVLHDLSNGQERIILEPGLYSSSGDAPSFIAAQWPMRLSPDSRWLSIPTPDEGTWLVSIDGQTRRQLSRERLEATWAPDSRRITFTYPKGPRPRAQDRSVYIQDVVTNKPPQLLIQLPGEGLPPAWSPSCDEASPDKAGDCGRSIAAFSRVHDAQDRYDYTAWLIDAASGKARELGHFAAPPVGGIGLPIWSPTGDEIETWGWFEPTAFPIDGSGPRPLINVCRSPCGEPSPDGSLRVWTQLISVRDDTSRLVVTRANSGASVTFDTDFDHVDGISWTSDSRRILLSSVTNGNLVLWAIDPASGQAKRVAAKITFFRTWDMLRSTQIGAKRVGLRPLSAAGDPSTWIAHELSGLGIRVRVPAEWRWEVRGSGSAETATLANFELDRSDGNAALSNDQIEITFERIQRPFDTDFSYWLTETARLEQYQVTAEVMTLAGHQAARVRVNIGPVSEQVRVPLGDGTELWITHRPLSSNPASVFEQILNSMTFTTLSQVLSSPMTTTLPARSPASDCPLPASLKIPETTHFDPIDGKGAVAYSSDGLQLVFPTSLLTTTVHSLATLGLNGVDRNFAWSPDATQIAFLYTDPRPDPCGYGYLMLADLAKGEVRPLIQKLARYGQPAWSPDGQRLALTDDAGRLSVVHIGDGSSMILSDRAAHLSTPGWTDTEHIVYAERPQPNNLTNLVSQARDGSAPSVLLQDVRTNEFALAPDGRRVAYYGGALYLADLQSNSIENLGLNPSERLQWSPDGKYLLGRGGMAGIFLVQPHASVPVSQVNFLGIPGSMQSWSPDGLRFAALIGPEDKPPTIGIYDVSAQALKDLSIVVQLPYALAWSTQDSNSTAMPHSVQEEDIREAVFRYQFEHNASGLQ